MFSIVVPAHNEASVVGRCLESLVTGSQPNELEIIVVCNGCTDSTADVARGIPGPITVIETSIASKTHALNLGDEAASGFPRWYVDADIRVSIDSLRKTNSEMQRLNALVGAPRMIVDLGDRNWAIRSYYDIWMRTPYVVEGMVGSGVYALSRIGRRRFDRFPDVIGDDAYVRLLFDRTERISVDDTAFTVDPPRSLWVLIKVRARRRIAAEEVPEAKNEAASADLVLQRSGLRVLGFQPRLWPKLVIYLAVRTAAEAVYRVRYQLLGRRGWERDGTSR